VPNDALLTRRQALILLLEVFLPAYAVALLDSGSLTVIRVRRRPRYRSSEISAMVAEARRMLAEAED
jgi:hypothetical protein